MNNIPQASFNIGEVIHHNRFNYRGVIVDVDADFQGSDEWYEENATTKPPKDAPWYHVLVDEDNVITYVAERNLEVDDDGIPVEHPMLDEMFIKSDSGKYQLRTSLN
jgi:heat shock protein HspQ